MNRAVAGLAVGAFVVSVVVTVVQPFTRRDVDAAACVAALRAFDTSATRSVQPGDTVLVHPPWRDDVVTALRAAHAVDDRVAVTEAFAPRHGDPWPPLVVVADHRWPLPRVLQERVRDADVVSVGGVDVFRVAGAARADVSAGASALAAAHVFVEEADGSTVECPWQPSARRHVCAGLPEWMHVGDDTLTIDGKPTRCTWSHPRTGATLVVDYGVVDVDGAVRVDVALADAAADNATGAAVHARVVVDEDEAAVDVHHDHGFHAATVDVAGKARGRVRLEFTTAHDGQRHTCYRLSTSQKKPPEPAR